MLLSTLGGRVLTEFLHIEGRVIMAKKQFKAESKRLLEMMINSIYTQREVFLRELISNASDAIDKLYYKSLTDPTLNFDKDSYFIKVTADKENRILKLLIPVLE